MWIFLIYQASTVEDVLEKLNRLSESIDVLQGDNNSIRETEKSDVTEMKDMIDSLNAESRSILERVEDMDRMSTRFVCYPCYLCNITSGAYTLYRLIPVRDVLHRLSGKYSCV